MPAPNADYSRRVAMDGREFVVDFDADGFVLRIKERKRTEKGWRAVTYRSGKRAIDKGERTMSWRIVVAARSEFRDATPR